MNCIVAAAGVSGNESISEARILKMKALRDRCDPHGGRAIGSREMLDSRTAEYGGETVEQTGGTPRVIRVIVFPLPPVWHRRQ